MSFRDISRIAGSAMTAQTVRLNTVASNIANADTASGAEQSAYRGRKPVFSSQMQGEGMGVQVLDVVQNQEPVRKAHEPGNPLADADGNVFYSNVNAVEEMTDMLSATRAFQTNVEVLAKVKTMQQDLLKLGDSA
ncbi:flagellar basal body rod protein FlgC [Chromobacterium violaceum]|uniref:Flagellar basal-body rod protein FlgC n=2 Tax=Chromobacterium violaceum TaxID=536 RepID=A0A1R0MUC6_CHRVL|nr:flagellar basal body rod protein FlgC [Chromobacterium violaceum]AAQ59377.1 flagellar basal-body rod protein flgC [Chromobacterium violaceum ATCC 12472]ATP28330.1 flagellar basal body rod protein FlgC [Chromobacterium violaceum]ATP32238.1 flagellar basal body rod protein FlgC [Chromobacterium violaceum]KJH68638.1 flagellar basal body rod protein FlgC [Chromobacterium violaceum]KMN51241.1 flagellar basal body rod protein FlgC [Chromobacterium violaceum]